MKCSVRTSSYGRAFRGARVRCGLWHVTALSSPKSKKANLGKTRCRAAKSRLVVEGQAVLTLWLRVLGRRFLGRRCKAAGGDPAGHAEVEVRRSRRARLRQHASGGRP